MDVPYAKLEQVQQGVARVLAHNPSAFTYYGTQTYLVGEREVAVIDPGPDLPEHVDALVTAVAGRKVVAIMCTHTHCDHSPAARPMSERTGAPVIGCAPLALETVGPRADASFDGDYTPMHVLEDGEVVEVDGCAISAVATPGHTSNHLCFAYGDALFSGDHVMGWSTSVVAPPDGDMGQYLASLEKLLAREETLFYPTHGSPIPDAKAWARQLIDHRRKREEQILAALGTGPGSTADLVPRLYPDIVPALHAAAAQQVRAHLLHLGEKGAVMRDGAVWRLRL